MSAMGTTDNKVQI